MRVLLLLSIIYYQPLAVYMREKMNKTCLFVKYILDIYIRQNLEYACNLFGDLFILLSIYNIDTDNCVLEVPNPY